MILRVSLLADVSKVTKLTHSKCHFRLTKSIENLGPDEVFNFKVERKKSSQKVQLPKQIIRNWDPEFYPEICVMT